MMLAVAGGVLIAAIICGLFAIGCKMAVDQESGMAWLFWIISAIAAIWIIVAGS